MINLAVVRAILADQFQRATLQAFLLTASENGHTIREMAEQLGVAKSTLHRWVAEARVRREGRGPRPELLEPIPGMAGKCPHQPGKIGPGRPRVCIECCLSNFEDHPIFKVKPTDARPPKSYKPDPVLRGGL